MSEEHAELIKEALKELEHSTPRELRWNSFDEAKSLWIRTSLLGLLFVFAVFFVVLGMLVPLSASWYGTPAMATVIDHDISHGFRGSISYSLTLQYKTGNENKRGFVGVSFETYSNTPLGSTVHIHYLPSFPTQPALDEDPPSFLVVWILAGMIGGLVYWVMRLRKQKYLLTYGKVVKGVMDEVDKSVGNTASFGGEKDFHVLSVPVYYYGKKSVPGDEILILRDPDNPENYIPYDPANFFWRPV